LEKLSCVYYNSAPNGVITVSMIKYNMFNEELRKELGIYLVGVAIM